MKNLVKSILVTAIALGSLSISAANFGTSIEVSRVERKLINLSLDHLEEGVTILLKDFSGEIIYKEKVKDKSYSKSFNLENLADGNYSLEFRGETVIKKTQFQIEKRNVVLNNDQEIIIFKPSVNLKGDTVIINKLAVDSDDVFTISFFDKDANLLYTEKIEGSKNLGKKLNISLLEAGSYDVVMESKGEIFYETIRKI